MRTGIGAQALVDNVRRATYKLLYVGNCPKALSTLRELLNTPASLMFELTTIPNDAAALSAVQRANADLVLIDFDNLSASPALQRFLLSTSNLPLLYLTARESLPQIEAGAPNFLTYSELSARNLLRAAQYIQQSLLAARTAQELLKSEHKYRDLVEASYDLIWAVDIDGCWTFVNRATRHIYGYEPHEMLGKPFVDFLANRLIERDLETFALLKTGLPIQRYETTHLRKDGSEIVLSFNAFPLQDASGKVIGASGTARDITQRKQRDLLLQKQREENQVIFDSVPALISFKDTHNKIVRINKPAAQVIGLPVDKIEGRNATEIFPNDAERFLEEDRQVIESGQPLFGIIEKLSLPTGQSRWLRTDKIPYRGESGEVAGVIVFSKDITDKLIAEENALRLQKQLTQSQKMEAIGQLAAGLAHDLNNSLAAVVGHLELMKLHPGLDKDLASSASVALSGCERASSLIDQLLGFARQGRYNLQVLSLSEAVTETTRFLAHVVNKDLRFIHERGPQEYFTLADSSQLQQILINLVINANQAMPQGGTLRFSYSIENFRETYSYNPNAKPGPYVCLAVKDSGPGIDPAIMDKIFEPFFTSKPDGEGTGLGLAMVYGIMQSHDGWVEVESQPACGTTFKLYFPQAESPRPLQAQQLSQAASKQSSHILVIDDEPALTDLTRIFLERSGFEVSAFCDAARAISWYRQNFKRIDLILLDMKMPNLDGERCFEQLRKIDPQAKVAILSGYAEDDVANRMLQTGAVKFHQKPLRYPELVKWVIEYTSTHAKA